MLPSTIAAANTEVMRVMNGHAILPSSSLLAEKRGVYNKYTPEFKAEVAYQLSSC